MNKTKLFALIDLDIQLQKINNYHFSDTEQIFRNLYKQTKVIREQTDQHRIWITGLIHKEAYFIAPDLQDVFDCSLLAPQYNNAPLSLEDVYLKIGSEISEDLDLRNNFERVINRINYCKYIDCCGIDKLKKTWNLEFNRSTDNRQMQELIFILLTIRKAKPYWNKIESDSDWSRNNKIFREQLSLEIGEFYSSQNWKDPENHLGCFFKTLYNFA